MWSNNYIKVPFKERGRDRDGADCWGLVMLVYLEQLGVKLPSLLFYEDTFDFSTIRKLVSEQTASDDWEEVERGQEKPFDVVVSRMVGYETHVGIVVKRGLMLHCERGSNTTHQEYDNKDWCERIYGIYRHAASPNKTPTI